MNSVFLNFTVSEQKRILEVGACLNCHNEKSKVMDLALDNFEQTLAKRSKRCILEEGAIKRYY